MLRQRVEQGVKDSQGGASAFLPGRCRAFANIATETGVHQISVGIVAAPRFGKIMVNGQFAPGVRLGDAAIAAAILTAPPNRLMLGMRRASNARRNEFDP